MWICLSSKWKSTFLKGYTDLKYRNNIFNQSLLFLVYVNFFKYLTIYPDVNITRHEVTKENQLGFFFLPFSFVQWSITYHFLPRICLLPINYLAFFFSWCWRLEKESSRMGPLSPSARKQLALGPNWSWWPERKLCIPHGWLESSALPPRVCTDGKLE